MARRRFARSCSDVRGRLRPQVCGPPSPASRRMRTTATGASTTRSTRPLVSVARPSPLRPRTSPEMGRCVRRISRPRPDARWEQQSERTTWIDYRGPSGTVRRVSALDVLNGQVAPGTFSDKRVVIGVTAPVTDDVHDTPFDRHARPRGAGKRTRHDPARRTDARRAAAVERPGNCAARRSAGGRHADSTPLARRHRRRGERPSCS